MAKPNNVVPVASIVLHPPSQWEIDKAGRYVDRVAGDDAEVMREMLGLPA